MNAPCLFVRRLGVDPFTRGPQAPKHLTPSLFDAMLKAVSAKYAVSPREVMSASLYDYAAHPRQALMWELRRLGFSYPEIGRAMNRDHTTVWFGCRAHERRQSAPVEASAA